MDWVFVILLLAILLGIYDLIRRVNINILRQTKELKKIRELHENNKD